jgi:hypothetical protein
MKDKKLDRYKNVGRPKDPNKKVRLQGLVKKETKKKVMDLKKKNDLSVGQVIDSLVEISSFFEHQTEVKNGK